MNNNTAAGVLSSFLNGQWPVMQDLVDAIKFCLNMLKNGYQSDIARAEAAVKPQIDELTTKLGNALATIGGETDRTQQAVDAATQLLTDKITAVTAAAQDTTSDPTTVVANVLAALGVAPAAPAPAPANDSASQDGTVQ